SLHSAQRVHRESVLEHISLGSALHLRGMVGSKQSLAVCHRSVKLVATESHGLVASNSSAQQSSAEQLACTVVTGDERGGPLAKVHHLGVIHNFAGKRELVFPGHMLQVLVEALL